MLIYVIDLKIGEYLSTMKRLDYFVYLFNCIDTGYKLFPSVFYAKIKDHGLCWVLQFSAC